MSFSPEPRNLKARYFTVIIILFLIFSLFTFRALELSINSPLPASVRPVPPPVRRGIIFDSRNHELAVSRDTASIAARPLEIINPERSAALLNRVLTPGYSEILNTLTGSDEPFVYLERKVKMSNAEEIRALKLPGIVILKEADRYYPNDRLASTVIGFTGLDNEGLAGIEFQYNRELTSNYRDLFIGNNVHLTLNAFIQHRLETVLRSRFESSQAKAAVGIISEVNTGRILAMASLPDFNPNRPSDFPTANHRNRTISDTYEPGSTFKIFTLSSLAREGLLDEDRLYNCPGYFEYKNHRLSFTHHLGDLTLREVIKKSCNEGVIKAAWRMPVLRFYENLRKFGFGSFTGINLPGESRGSLRPPQKWDIWLKMTVPIGHGISVTPLQLVTAANSVANGGQLLRPVIIDKITTPGGKTLQSFKTEKISEPVNEQISQKILSYLESVVSRGGTGVRANLNLPQYKVCGKTGTSIKYTRKGYEKGKYQASFIGFFPCNRPEISILIMFDEPKGDAYQGGQVAAPVFKLVLEDIIPNIHFGKIGKVSRMRSIQFKTGDKPTQMPNLTGKSKKEVIRYILTHFPGDHKFLGEGYLLESNPTAGSPVSEPYSFTLRFGFP